MHPMMFGLFYCGYDVMLGCHASFIRVPPCCAVGCFISRRERVNNEDSARRCVSVARFHGPAKPAFCRYRQGELLLIIKQ